MPARTRHLCRAFAAALAATALAPAGAHAISYNFDFQFGSRGAGAGQFSQPQGIAVDPSDGDLVKKKTFVVTAGHQYFARARRR